MEHENLSLFPEETQMSLKSLSCYTFDSIWFTPRILFGIEKTIWKKDLMLCVSSFSTDGRLVSHRFQNSKFPAWPLPQTTLTSEELDVRLVDLLHGDFLKLIGHFKYNILFNICKWQKI